MGHVDGTPIRKCLSCGVGLSVGGLGRARVIPNDIWSKMQAEWNQAFPPPVSGPTIGGAEVANRPAWLEAGMTVAEREQRETAWRALHEIDHYRLEIPASLAEAHQAYVRMLIPDGQDGQWSRAELEQLARGLCEWGYATRLWEENRFPDVAPARIPQVETVVGQSMRAADVPTGAEVANASAALADGKGEDPDELVAAIPGVNSEMRASVSFEAVSTGLNAAMKGARKLAPPPSFDYDRQAQCWRFGYFTRCCEASAPPSPQG